MEIRHFRDKGHNVPDSVQKVIKLRLATSHEGQNKGSYSILDDFHEIHEDSMLIHHKEMVTIILHEFVPLIEVLDATVVIDFLRVGRTQIQISFCDLMHQISTLKNNA